MSAGTVIGASGELVEQPGSPFETKTEAGRTIRRVFHWAGAGSPSVAAIGSGYDSLKLKSIDIETLTSRSKKVTYNYGEDAQELGLIPYSQLAETSTEFDSNTVEIPIEQHPSYDSDPDTGWPATKPGVDTYLDPQPVRRDVNYQTTLDTDASDVGKRGQNGYSNDWLYTRMSCRKIGVTRLNGGTLYDVYERVREYQFARNGWDADIYNWI
ncbi:MAG TPA: hypothetical protein VJ904_01190 [Tichowtungia sp.]|nr:hypothetical protein [Tichowtungia sp.]